MTRLRIASINIERSKHLHRVDAFLQTYKPDVLCLQELMRSDIAFFEDIMGNAMAFAPMLKGPSPDKEGLDDAQGVGIIGWGALTGVTRTYYHGTAAEAVEHHTGYGDNTTPNVLLAASYQGFRIATTHLNVTVHGEATPSQQASAAKLVAAAQAESKAHDGLLLCGDFNAPRGRATFSLISQAFEDGIPSHYTSSLDPDLHRAGPIPFMVDGLFHTPSYLLADAKLHTGISDHCALTCTLSKR
ncbi:MAG: endonuclease/exonuclease/phosphatase family protein [Blastochloris viridis]|uniref:Endonuclease/exonuclease/phosphatase family protein n=1 Tax=Blastochloris viridis TaxID=1079 RepID=A0A6N4RFH3_BLAVI|nr:MAG: endonuclease/exonuclease/phosphatase family protein [Blastochloris viridis]